MNAPGENDETADAEQCADRAGPKGATQQKGHQERVNDEKCSSTARDQRIPVPSGIKLPDRKTSRSN